MRLEGLAGDRLWLLRQRMVDADDGDDVDCGEKIGHEIGGSCRRRRKNGELGHAVAQALLGAPEALGEDGDRHVRKFVAQRLQARDQRLVRKDRVHREHEFRLDLSRYARRPPLQGYRAFQEPPCVPCERYASRGEAWRLGRPVEQGDAEMAFERRDRLAHRRLHPTELPRRSGKAALVDGGDEDPHLVERQGVDHRANLSHQSIEVITIWPVVLMPMRAHVAAQLRRQHMTVVLNARGAGIGAAAQAQIFTEARTHNAFLDRPVPNALLVEALDLAKMGPTAANQQPLRVLFLRSPEAKERLRPAMSPGNVEKTMAAPVVAVTGHDLKFYEHLPFLFPHADGKSWFAGNPEFAARSAAQSGTRQVGYLILALRAVGLDAGPMGGFDAAKVEAEFFPEGKIKANVVINIGYGDDAQLFPRSPRLSFDQMAKVL